MDKFDGAPTESEKLEFAVHLEEFRAMRAEIIEHLRFQSNALTFGTSVLAAAGAAMATIYTKQTPDEPHSFLLCFLLATLPLLAFVFGMWMVHKDSMIAELAGYINSVLRPRLIFITGSKSLLDWSSFLTQRTYRSAIRKPPRVLSVFGHVFFGH